MVTESVAIYLRLEKSISESGFRYGTNCVGMVHFYLRKIIGKRCLRLLT